MLFKRKTSSNLSPLSLPIYFRVTVAIAPHYRCAIAEQKKQGFMYYYRLSIQINLIYLIKLQIF